MTAPLPAPGAGPQGPPTVKPLLSPYRAAQLAARERAGTLSAAAAKQIRAELEDYAARLAALLKTLPADKSAALTATRKIILEQSAALSKAITDAVTQGRRLTFAEVLAVQDTASAAAAKAAGVVGGSLLGQVRGGLVTMAGAYTNLGGAASWKTRLTGYVTETAQDLDRIVRTAILEGVSVDALATRLRPYVAGAAPFHQAFAGDAFAKLANMQGVPKPLREAGRKLRYQAERIAYSEILNARAEAELAHYAVDPLVEAVRWTLSPFRGNLDGPDVCDALAVNDWYGMGPGIYPLAAVPPPPHPYDRCERVPVLRAPELAHEPKPNPPRKLDPKDAALYRGTGVGYLPRPAGGAAGAAALTEKAAARIRAELGEVVVAAGAGPWASAMQSLVEAVDHGAVKALFSPPLGPLSAAKALLDQLGGTGASVPTAPFAAVQKLGLDATAAYDEAQQLFRAAGTTRVLEELPVADVAAGWGTASRADVLDAITKLHATPHPLKAVRFGGVVRVERHQELIAFRALHPNTPTIPLLVADYDAAVAVQAAAVAAAQAAAAAVPSPVDAALAALGTLPKGGKSIYMKSFATYDKAAKAGLEQAIATAGATGGTPATVAVAELRVVVQHVYEPTLIKAIAEQAAAPTPITVYRWQGKLYTQDRAALGAKRLLEPTATTLDVELVDLDAALKAKAPPPPPPKAPPVAAKAPTAPAATVAGSPPPPVPPVAPAAPVAAPVAPAGVPAPGAGAATYAASSIDPAVVLGKKTGAATGKNATGLSGFWRGTDGADYYVKEYPDPSMAWGEHLTNTVYRSLGINAPESVVFTGPNGKTLFASRIVAGVEGELKTVGLTKARADGILDGFVADALTANWDVVGVNEGYMRNVVVLKDGRLFRIDQGGSFLFGGAGGRKKPAVLAKLDEWELFTKASVNVSYAEVFQAAGLATADDLGLKAVGQIDRILALRKANGGWGAFVDAVTPGMVPADRQQIVAMLEARTVLLEKKRAQLVAKFGAPPAPAAVATPAPTIAGTPILTPKAAAPLPAVPNAAPSVPPPKTFPAPKGKAANQYVEQLVQSGNYTADEVLAQVQAVYPKTVFTLDNVKAKFKKLGVAEPVPLAAKAGGATPPPVGTPPLVAAKGQAALHGVTDDVFNDALELVTIHKVAPQSVAQTLATNFPGVDAKIMLAGLEAAAQGATLPSAPSALLAQVFPFAGTSSKQLVAEVADAIAAGTYLQSPAEASWHIIMKLGGGNPKLIADDIVAQLKAKGVAAKLTDIDEAMIAYGAAGVPGYGNKPLYLALEELTEEIMAGTISSPDAKALLEVVFAMDGDELATKLIFAKVSKKLAAKKVAAAAAAPAAPAAPAGSAAATGAASATVSPGAKQLLESTLTKYAGKAVTVPDASWSVLNDAVAGLKKGKLDAYYLLNDLGLIGDPYNGAMGYNVLYKKFVTPKNAAALTPAKLEKVFGVVPPPGAIALADVGQKLAILKEAFHALAGDPAALAALQSKGFNVTKLLAKIKKAKKAASQKTIGLAAPSVGKVATPAAPAVAPPIAPVSHNALPWKIDTKQAPAFVADSQVTEDLYFSTVGTKSAAAIDAGALDLTKAADTTYGHAFVLSTATPSGGKVWTFKVKVTAPLKGTKAQLDAAMQKLGVLASDAPDVKRTKILGAGYDAVVEVDGTGKVTKVYALQPEKVKLFDKPAPAPPPPPGAAPQVPNVDPKAPAGKGYAPTARDLEDRAVADTILDATLTTKQVDTIRKTYRTPLKFGGAEHRLAQKYRREAFDAVLARRLPAGGKARAARLREVYDEALSSWYGSSNSGPSAALKLAHEESGLALRSTFHGTFYDSDDALRDRYLVQAAMKWLTSKGVTLDEFVEAVRAEANVNRALLKRVHGGATFTLRRGEETRFFSAQGVPVPKVGEELTVLFNSVASSSVNPNHQWGSITLEFEVTIEDVTTLYWTNESPNASSYWTSEREYWLTGRPRRARRVA